MGLSGAERLEASRGLPVITTGSSQGHNTTLCTNSYRPSSLNDEEKNKDRVRTLRTIKQSQCDKTITTVTSFTASRSNLTVLHMFLPPFGFELFFYSGDETDQG